MSIFSVITIVLFVIYIFTLLFLLKKSGKSLRFIFLEAVISLILVAILNLTSFATNLYIPINECTVLGVSLGGLPMILCFLLLKIIFVL